MDAILLVIHLIIAVAIVVIVMVQPSETGGFMGNSGSMSNMLAPRRKSDALTRATTFLAAAFFVTSLLLAVVAGHKPESKSILDAAPAETTAPAAAAEPETPKAPISQ